MGTYPGSLSEGAGSPQGLTEGVSSDGSTGPMVYPQAIIGSEIFERLRSSKYTPSVSHSLDSSLREGAGVGCVPFNLPPGNRKGAGDFHRPYEGSDFFTGYVHRRTLPQSRPLGVTAPSEREPGGGCVPFNVPLGNCGVAGDFHRPYGGRVGLIVLLKSLRFLTQKRYRVGQGTDGLVESAKRN